MQLKSKNKKENQLNEVKYFSKLKQNVLQFLMLLGM